MIIAGTGHRPSKLYGGYSNEGIEYLVKIATIKLEGYKPEVVVNGLALGWDIGLAIAAIRLEIPLHSYMPFKGQELQWPQKSQDIYNRILDKSAKIVVVCEGGYEPAKMQIRNEAMVNNCDLVLALWDGTPGGTNNCVNYANKIGRPLDNCWDLYLEHLPND